jgi:(p)ppGpp synthase/HD superfamily hydrolase
MKTNRRYAVLLESELITSARTAAARWHDGQRRKGADRAPYIIHPTEVAALVAEAGADDVTIAAALLHDVVEDTLGTEEDIRAAFGPEVAKIVMELTDDKRLPAAERKHLQLETTRAKSYAARLIKIADKTSNVRSITTNPPTDWSPERQRQYVAWCASVVDTIRGTSTILEEEFDRAVAELPL